MDPFEGANFLSHGTWRMWAIWLMGALSIVGAIMTGMLAVLVTRSPRSADPTVHVFQVVTWVVASAFSAWFAAYIFVAPFRGWWNSLMASW